MEKEVFDSLNYAKDLESAGFTRLQAEKQVGFMGKIISDHLATKTYLDGRLTELRHDFEIKLKDQMLGFNKMLNLKLSLALAAIGVGMTILGYLITR